MSFTYVPASSGTAGNGGTVSVATLSGLTSIPAGSVICVMALWGSAGATTTTITDNAGGGTNTWTAIGPTMASATQSITKFFVCVVQFGGITSITQTNTNNNGSFSAIFVDTFTVSGGTAGTPSGNAQIQLSLASGTAAATPTISSVPAGALTWAVTTNDTGNLNVTGIVTTGFTNGQNGGFPSAQWDGYSTSKSGSVAVTWTHNATDDYANGIITVPLVTAVVAWRNWRQMGPLLAQ